MRTKQTSQTEIGHNLCTCIHIVHKIKMILRDYQLESNENVMYSHNLILYSNKAYKIYLYQVG